MDRPFIPHVEEEVVALFARCPDLAGFSVQGEAGELFVSDVGIATRLSAESYGEIFQDIAATIAALVEAEPALQALLRGRTFARTLH
jgi:hypothetical protein